MRSPVRAYGVSLAAASAAVVVRVLLDPLLGDHLPFITLFPAIAFVAWYGGRRPALLALVVSSLAVAYFIIQPRFSFVIADTEYQAGLVLYVLIGLGFIAMFESLRKAGLQAAEQRERLGTTLASIGDAVIATDTEGRIISMNVMAESLTGWTQQEATGQPLDTVFHIVNEETRRPVPNPAAKAIREGVILGLANNTILVARDGTEPIDDSAAPIRCQEGQIVGCVLVFRDVTRRREQERTLRRQAEQLREQARLLDSAHVAVRDFDGRIRYWNTGAVQLYGFTDNEAIGRVSHHLFHTVFPQPLEDINATLLREGQWQGELIHTRRDGQQIVVASHWSLHRGDDGQPGRVVEVNNDVTELNRLRLALHDEREFLRVTLTSIGDAVLTTDSDGRVTFLNAVAESLTGWKLAEATGQRLDAVFRIMNEETRQNVENPAMKALNEGSVVGLANHTVLIARDGTERPIDDSAAPIRGKEGQIVGCVLVFRDVTERRRLEKQNVEQGEAARKLAAIVDSSEDAIISKSLDGIIQSWNAAAERVFGYNAEEVVGSSITMLFPADRLDEEEGIIARVRAGERVEHFDTVRRRKDGTAIPVSLTISPIKDEKGRIIGASKIARDITERKRAEAAAAEQHRLTSLRADIAAALASAAKPPTTLQQCTEAIVRHLDVAFARIWTLNEGEQVLELRASAGLYTHLNGPHRRVKVGQFKIGRIAVSRQPHLTNDVRHDPNISDPAWAEREGMAAFAGFPLMIEGRVLGVVAVFARRPLTEAVVSDLGTLAEGIGQYLDRKRAEERLRLLSEAAAVILLAPAPDVLVRTLFAKIGPTIGADMYWNYIVNETGDGLRLASCVGLPEEAVLPRLEFGDHLCGTAALHRHPVVVAHVQQCSDPKAQVVKQLGVRAYAGFPLMSGNLLLGTFSFASRSKDEFDADEREFLETICHYVAVAYERLRLMEKLRQADRKKDEFLATLAHELRNPLAPIRTGLQLMQLAGGKVETVEQARTMMERQVVQMVRLVDDLMDLTRISQGKIKLKKELVGLAAVMNCAVETARPLIEEMGHELTVLPPEQPIIVEADSTRLAQVFSNLLTNAAKYTDRGGRIWLTAERQGSDVVVAVKDTGIGIPADKLRSIFEMFSQVEGALSRSQGGLGIGLCLVNQLVQMHGGSIEAESEGRGRGSRFVVRLPIIVQQHDAITAGNDGVTVTAASKLRILVVDDNRDAAESLAMLLKIMGNNVRTAGDGEQAVQAAGEFRPLVVLLDIGLPKLNGYEACRRLREQSWGKSIFLIAVTGWGQDEDRRLSHEAGFDHHMVKPVDPQELMTLLAGLQQVKS